MQAIFMAVFFTGAMYAVRAPLGQQIAVPMFFSLLSFVLGYFLRRAVLRRFLARAIRNG
jgi:hypothetical protein